MDIAGRAVHIGSGSARRTVGGRPTIGAYINGTVVPASVLTDTAIATGTKADIRSVSAGAPFWFDNVNVWDLAA